MRYNIITIEREYASGGSEIGQKLAEKLSIPCHGKDILDKASEKMRLPVNNAQYIEETITDSFLYGLYMRASQPIEKMQSIASAQMLSRSEAEVIEELAATGPCVMVGHCAAGVLRERKDVLRVFIYSNHNTRKDRTISVYRHESKEAEGIIRQFDKRRANYYKANVGVDWKEPSNYHMMLDSGLLGLDTVVDLLYQCVR